MTKRKNTEAAQVEATVTVEGQTDPFAQIQVDLLDVLGNPICEHGRLPRGFKLAPIAREMGVSQIQLAKYMFTGEGFGTKNLKRALEYINAKRGVATDEQAAALAEVASL